MRTTNVCFDSTRYQRTSEFFPLAIPTFREFVGTSYSLDSAGFLPVVQLPKLDQREERQRETNGYIRTIFTLNPPLELCLQNDRRELLDRALLSLYDHGINDNFRTIKRENDPTNNGTALEIVDKMPEDGDHLEIPDDPIQTIDLRSSYCSGISEAKRNLEEYGDDPSLAIIGLMASDLAYCAVILNADNVGVKHPDPDIRKVTWTALEIWVQSLSYKPSTLSHSSSVIATPLGLQKEKDLADLNLIFKALLQNHCGLDDRDEDVKTKAHEVFKTCRDIKALMVNPEEQSSIALRN